MRTFHSQNLTDGRLPTWRHGRAWWRRWRAEWLIFHQPNFHIGIEKGGYSSDGRGVQIAVCLWVFSLYVTYNTGRHQSVRELCVYWHEGCLWITPWIDGEDGFDRSAPWYRRAIVLHVGDWILGKPRYTCEQGQPTEVLIPMPEGCYRAVFTPTTRTWKRRFSTKVSAGHDINIPSGIPFEGKGENSWDCGEDGLFGISSAGSIEEGVAKVVATVLEYRRRNGGSHAHRGRHVVIA